MAVAAPSAPGSFVQAGPFIVRPFGARNVVFPPFFGYPESYPFTYFYPSLWPPLDVQYQQATLIANGDVAAEVAAQEKEYLSNQVQSLKDELSSLQQASRQSPAPPSAETPGQQPSAQPQSRTQQTFPVTVFVYRDGHEMEARDYAVFGQTLWVFDGQSARKFPLSAFNMAASRQVNEEHGVEFPLSDQHPQ
ncbi:MAG TPA: hypothetical protein VFZ27_15935 [Terriglobia bacterium]|nr:hypothetical protein [Terriglobia bacterium]